MNQVLRNACTNNASGDTNQISNQMYTMGSSKRYNKRITEYVQIGVTAYPFDIITTRYTRYE